MKHLFVLSFLIGIGLGFGMAFWIILSVVTDLDTFGHDRFLYQTGFKVETSREADRPSVPNK